MNSAKIMFGYAGFLALCGFAAFAIAAARGEMQYTALIPLAPAVLMILCGVMANAYPRNHKVGMIGIHAGLVLPALFGLLLAVQAFRALGERPGYLITIFFIMVIGSFVAVAMLVRLRPKPEDRT